MKREKNLNFELNLVPMIDVFSACICFLLLTVAWIEIGSLSARQATGSEITKVSNPPSYVVHMNSDASLEISFRNLKRQNPVITLKAANQSVDFEKLDQYLKQIKEELPEVKTALLFPSEKSNYQAVIKIMDRFQQYGIKEIGITPL